MKAIKSLKPILTMGYLVAFFCLLIGLQALLARHIGVDLAAATLTMVVSAITLAVKLTGWTLVIFTPLALRVGFHATNAYLGKLRPEHHREMLHLQEAAIVTGMIGTLWAFIATAMNYAEYGASGDTLATLMAILMGLGSTLVGVLIAGLIQAIFIFAPEKHP